MILFERKNIITPFRKQRKAKRNGFKLTYVKKVDFSTTDHIIFTTNNKKISLLIVTTFLLKLFVFLIEVKLLPDDILYITINDDF